MVKKYNYCNFGELYIHKVFLPQTEWRKIAKEKIEEEKNSLHFIVVKYMHVAGTNILNFEKICKNM